MSNDEDEIAGQRDEIIKRMIGMPPKAHTEEPKRRGTPSPEVHQLPKRRTNKKRSKA